MKNRNQKNNVINFPTTMSESEREIEAILFSAEEPLDIESIESKIKKKKNITKSLEKLQHHYAERGVKIVCI